MAKNSGSVRMRKNVSIPSALKKVLKGQHLKTAQGLRSSGAVAVKIVKKAASSKAMTGDYLSSVDHPYARRHGSIQKSSLRSPFSGSPYMIGKDGGSVAASVKGQLLNQFCYKVFIDPKSQRVVWLIEGTRVMIGRDLIGMALGTPEAQKAMFDAFVKGAR